MSLQHWHHQAKTIQPSICGWLKSMDACPGARADEKILDPYQYPGQHVGTIISFWMMSGCMLMLSLWCLNRARSTSGKSSELGERRCMLLLTCHMISCFLAFLLQAIGHSFIPAGQNARLLLVGRIFLALAAGSIQAVGTGICEANWPNRCIWAILWLMTLCSTIGILVEGCGNTLLKTNSSHHEAWPQKENHLPNPIFQVRTLSFRESHVLFLLASFCCRSETICSFQKNGEFPYFVEHPSRVETTYWTHPPPLS